jgi:hypothetical protein
MSKQILDDNAAWQAEKSCTVKQLFSLVQKSFRFGCFFFKLQQASNFLLAYIGMVIFEIVALISI